jgi:hypothetical protein
LLLKVLVNLTDGSFLVDAEGLEDEDVGIFVTGLADVGI